MKHKARKQCCQIQTGNAAGERKPQIVRERGIKMNFKKAFTLFAAGIVTAGMIAGTGVPAMAAEKIGEAAAEEIAPRREQSTAQQSTRSSSGHLPKNMIMTFPWQTARS